jgi:PhzF family phenazine biosynthesis protein
MGNNKEINEFRIYRANAFVKTPYQGNPAGVCLLPAEKSEDFYRKVAIKMDMAETAFIVKDNDIFHLKWFTRGGVEVDLCGHATLATAYILSEKGYVNPGEAIHFQTKSGVLTAQSDKEYITLGFPLVKVTEVKNSEYDFKELMGFSPLYTGRTQFDYLLVADSEQTVKNCAPDFGKLKKIDARGIIVTAKSESAGYDFISRFFAPSIGVNEDPVTGSAHCSLGPYWGSILKKNKLVGYQASREGGIVGVEVLKNSVLLSGKAQEVALSDELKEIIRSFYLQDR